jgi:hypothetical protein
VIYLYLDRLNGRLTARWKRTHREEAPLAHDLVLPAAGADGTRSLTEPQS